MKIDSLDLKVSLLKFIMRTEEDSSVGYEEAL